MNRNGQHHYPAISAAVADANAIAALKAAAHTLDGSINQLQPAAAQDIPLDHHLAVLHHHPQPIRDLREAGFDNAIIAIEQPHAPAGWAAAAIEAGADDAIPAQHLTTTAAPELIEKALTIASRRRRAAAERAHALTTAADANNNAARLAERVALLESQAWTDPLTGLANRRQLFARLDRMFAEAVRYTSDLACAMLDLDGFKALNDKLGHRQGDDCLKRAARAVAESVRASDVAARYGGDEFVILMPRTNIAEASRVARRTADAFHHNVNQWCNACTPPGLSVGVSSVNATKPLDPEGLIDAADKAMYASKAEGSGRVMIAHHNATPTAAAEA